MVIIGLSGGAGVGKTTIARLFSKFGGAAVFDADKEVHRMYESDKKIIAMIKEYFPNAVCGERVSRKQLTRHFLENNSKWHALQSVIHKNIMQKQRRFIQNNQRAGTRLVVLDVPLLLEKGFWRYCDVIVHVYANPQTQLRRLKLRGMSEEYIMFLLSQQVNATKRRNFADFFINTCDCMKNVSCSVLDIIRYRFFSIHYDSLAKCSAVRIIPGYLGKNV